MNVMNVGKPLAGAQILLNIKEFILERNPTNVVNVEKLSFIHQLLFNTKELILERNPLGVMNVGKALSVVHHASDIKEFT